MNLTARPGICDVADEDRFKQPPWLAITVASSEPEAIRCRYASEDLLAVGRRKNRVHEIGRTTRSRCRESPLHVQTPPFDAERVIGPYDEHLDSRRASSHSHRIARAWHRLSTDPRTHCGMSGRFTRPSLRRANWSRSHSATARQPSHRRGWPLPRHRRRSEG